MPNFFWLNRPEGDTGIFNISINSQQICEKNDIKYLGIILDNKLNWKPHIANLTTQTSKIMWDIIQNETLYHPACIKSCV